MDDTDLRAPAGGARHGTDGAVDDRWSRKSHGAVRIWRVDIGRVPLYLLDTDWPENHPIDRWITARLYVGDPQTRLAQYVLLGVGGIRALGALGIEPCVVHLNEGHAALASFELAAVLRDGDSRCGAGRRAEATVFTTHTPVPAGNDTYPPEQVKRVLGHRRELSVPIEELIALGRTRPDDEKEDVGVTQAALRISRHANACQSPARRSGSRDVEAALAGTACRACRSAT